MSDLLPRYYELLRVAWDTSEEEDLYDVDSANPASWEEWQMLRQEAVVAQINLVEFLMAEGWALLSLLRQQRDNPEEE